MTCDGNCNAHGTCSNGVCNCAAGWQGTNCDQRLLCLHDARSRVGLPMSQALEFDVKYLQPSCEMTSYAHKCELHDLEVITAPCIRTAYLSTMLQMSIDFFAHLVFTAYCPNCNSNGLCVAPYTCNCYPGWAGSDCSIFGSFDVKR